jgi:mannitol operon repressor
MGSKAEQPETLELSELLKGFNKESDRGRALVAASLLDQRLKGILEAFLLKDKVSSQLVDGFNAPLGTFSARTAASYALGLIQKNEFDEINLIRKIRNEFGHQWKAITFRSARVADLCNKLPWLGPVDIGRDEPKVRFTFAVVVLLTDLMWREKLVLKEQRVGRKWPNRSRG